MTPGTRYDQIYLAERVPRPSGGDSPATPIVRVRPNQVAHRALVGHLPIASHKKATRKGELNGGKKNAGRQAGRQAVVGKEARKEKPTWSDSHVAAKHVSRGYDGEAGVR